jgi:hypothetical protein
MWYTPLHTDRGIMRIDTIFQVNGDVPAVFDVVDSGCREAE